MHVTQKMVYFLMWRKKVWEDYLQPALTLMCVRIVVFLWPELLLNSDDSHISLRATYFACVLVWISDPRLWVERDHTNVHSLTLAP